MVSENLCKKCRNKEITIYGCQNESSIAGTGECANYEIEKNKLCSVWFCKSEGVHYHHRGGCGIVFCDEHEAQDKNPNVPIVELEG